MEQQKKNPLSHPLRSEPGRRYVPGRIVPRVGSDIRPSVRLNSSSKPKQEKQRPPHITNQIIDGIQTKATKKSRKISVAKPALPRTARSLVLKRQILDAAKEQRKKARQIYWRHIISYLLVGIVIISLAIVGWSFKDLIPVHLSIFDRQQKPKVVNEVNINQEVNKLDETTVTAEEIKAHTMGKDEPKILRIPKLDLEARIRRVGISLNNEPISPNNIFDIGWFEASGKPGSPGAVLLNGHAIGPTKDGIFKRIIKLVPEDKIIIERGDGTVLTYKVSKVQEYLTSSLDMSAATNSIDQTKQGLNLVTTINKYSSRAGDSNKRIIVFAVQ